MTWIVCVVINIVLLTGNCLDINVGYMGEIPSVDLLMTANTTLQFLATFSSEFQQDLVYHQLKNCPYNSMCMFSLNLTINSFSETPCCAKCSCNFPACLFSRTCCLDILLHYTDVNPEHIEEDKTPCMPMHLRNETQIKLTVGERGGAFMYVSCPPGSEEQLNINCTRQYSSKLSHYKDIVPVTNMLTSIMFRNAYCAYCNGVEDKYLAHADIHLQCNTNATPSTERDVIKAALGAGTCGVRFETTDLFTFEECTVAIIQCNVTGLWQEFDANIEKACTLYRNVIKVQDEFYNNIFCAMCNGIHVDDYIRVCLDDIHRTEVPFSFSGLLKLESGEDNGDDKSNQHECSEDQLYDYINNKCRDIICSPLMHLKQGKCEKSYSKVRTLRYRMYLRIKPIEPITLGQGFFLADQLINYVYNLHLLDGVCGIQLIYHIAQSEQTFGNGSSNGSSIGSSNGSSNTTASTSMSYFKMRVQVDKERYYHDPYELYDLFSMFHQSTYNIQYFDFDERRVKNVHAEFEMMDDMSNLYDHLANLTTTPEYSSMMYVEVGDQLPMPLELLIEEYSYATDDAAVNILHLRFDDFVGSCSELEGAELNVLHLNPCPKVLLSKQKIGLEETDEGYKLSETSMVIGTNEFFYNSSNTIVICVEVYEQYMRLLQDTSFSTMTIISIVCTIVSLVSLVLTLIVFLALPKLRKNVPGKNNMSLVSVLICAQCVYLLSGMGLFEAGSPQCVVVGMLLHFSWLLSLFWMNICTYHMFHVLTQTKVISHRSGKYRVLLYHMYALVMSAILVAVNVIIAMSDSGTYGYGDTVCYISSQAMIAFTFGIPVAVIIIVNLCLYFVVVYKIGMSPSVQKNVKHERNDFLIFIKLSTITGATWIFGLINYWANLSVLSYMFIILNASQGVFIMFVFILNHRVFNMFRRDVLGQDVMLTDTESSKTTKTNTRL